MSHGRSPTRRVGEHDVVLDVPATARSLRLIRLAAADAAADLGFDLDAVESARIAVDELSAILFDTGDWSRLVLHLDRGNGLLRVSGQVSGGAGGTGPVQVDRVVQELLSTCVVEYTVDEGGSDDDAVAGGGPWFTCSISGGPGA